MQAVNKSAIAVLWCLIGLAIGTILGMWFPPDVLVVPPSCSGHVLWCFAYTWQTLIAGGFALVGAVFLWIQIQDDREKKKQEDQRRQIKVRMQMPHALSQNHKYLESCLKAWQYKDLSLKEEPPLDALNVLMDAAVDADKQTFEIIRKLVHHAQPFEARLRDCEPEQRAQNYWENMLDGTLYFCMLNDSLYDYGRFEADSAHIIKATPAEFRRLLKTCGGIKISVALQNPAEEELQQRIEASFKQRFRQLD